jgi:hypothetical protein
MLFNVNHFINYFYKKVLDIMCFVACLPCKWFGANLGKDLINNLYIYYNK